LKASVDVVKQVRVLRNVVIWGVLCALVLWLVRGRLWDNRSAILLGVVAGSVYAVWHWRHFSRRITRRDRRFARNKIFVHYLSTTEVLLSAVAYNPYLAIPIGVALLVGVLLSALSGAWWAVMIGTFGLASSAVLAGCIMRDEWLHGPLHYQYDSRRWVGAEGMLYRTATVVKPLIPAGKVDYQGELWNAVSLSGEPIDVGEHVEVISVERLTLYVDRAPQSGPSTARG
jgi:membrane protein implicated in regulation of membrane protease activity